MIDLHPYLQITDDDVKSLSKFSKDSSPSSRVTNSVKIAFTFQSQSGKYVYCLMSIEKEATEKSETEENDPKLLKFLTNTSETTSMQENNNEVPPSMMPKLSFYPDDNNEK